MTTTPLRRILVANRGEIARRIIRAAHGLGIEAAAVFSDADTGAVHVSEADVAVRLPGSHPTETYLDVDRLIDAARRVGADAIHPGYGFIAENADAAQAVLDAGLVWIGPQPEAMRAMASKLEAKRIVAEAGVPVLPGVHLDTDDESDWHAAGQQVGYPLLVKASAGGGGRGMRVVDAADALADAVRAARREAASAFGDSTVYCERYVRRGRHIEVQVIGDAAGTVVHAYERECSLQRRHQKILEESPSPGTHPDVLARMYSAAVTAARAVGYTSLGTVEFLLDDPDEAREPGTDPDADFFFLEMNTRLQVEHPVTEATTGVDLVQTQIRLASGHPLPVRQQDVTRSGHAVEVRLVAEDPGAGWLPSSGRLIRFEPPDVPGVRWDTGVVSGSTVPAAYDSLIAKVIAHAPTRDEALDRLRAALCGLRVHGVATNREALIALVDDVDVRAGRTTIDLLETWTADADLTVPASVLDVHAVAAALAAAASREDQRASAGLGPAGWRSMADSVDVTTLVGPLVGPPVGPTAGPAQRAVTLRTARSGAVTAALGDAESVPVIVHGWDGEWLDHEVDGVRRRAAVLMSVPADEAPTSFAVFADGRSTTWEEPPRLPAGDRSEAARGPSSPVPGTVVAVHVSSGDTVSTGDTLVVLEAMKMEHRLLADSDGTVLEVVVGVGDAVDAHEVLVVLEPIAVAPTQEESR
jgi:propionyl-CoA carboxylase alpha chain